MGKHNIDPAHEAVMRHSLPELIQALERGSAVDSLDREGRTPLFYAAQDGDHAIAAELLRRGATANAQDRHLKTPLHFAASECRTEVAELLLKSGASVDAQDSNGNTPLSDAVFESMGRGQTIKLLLAYGANKSLKNNHGVSPEDLANSIANYDVRQFLTE
jgi:ankyrin repeat protein